MGEGEKERSKIRCPTYTQNNDCRSPSKEQYWPLIWFFHFSRVKKPVIRSVHVLITQMKAIKQYLLQGGAI